jgi:hypothetical protein
MPEHKAFVMTEGEKNEYPEKISDFRLRSDTGDGLEQGTPCTKFAVSAGIFIFSSHKRLCLSGVIGLPFVFN